MSNKTRLQTNNTNLQALIDKANALPDAEGGSGGAETCTLNVLVANVFLQSTFCLLISSTGFTNDTVVPLYYINGMHMSDHITIEELPAGHQVIKLNNVLIGSTVNVIFGSSENNYEWGMATTLDSSNYYSGGISAEIWHLTGIVNMEPDSTASIEIIPY